MTVLKHFNAILDWHRQQKSPVSKNLRPGLAPEKFQNKAKHLPFTLPSELKSLYFLHDGIKDNVPLFNSFTFLTFNDAIAEYELACEMAEEFEVPESQDGKKAPKLEDYWKSTWFPVFGFQGDYYLIDTAKGSRSPVYGRSGEEAAVVWYDSLEKMLLTIRTCFEKGAYFYDDDEILSEDHEKANSIREQINSKAFKLEVQSREPSRQELDEQPDGTKRLTSWFEEEGHYIEQFYGPDQRKIGQSEYYQGELMRRDAYEYPAPGEVEITSENLMGMMMTTKTRGKIQPDGSVETTHVQTFMQGQMLFEQDLTKPFDELDWGDDDEDEDEDEEA